MTLLVEGVSSDLLKSEIEQNNLETFSLALDKEQ